MWRSSPIPTMALLISRLIVKKPFNIQTLPLISTIIAPAAPEVLKIYYSTNQTLGAFVTSVYLLGYVFGPLIIAPLSEIYGRVIVYSVCNFIFVIFTIACALANNLGALIVFRLLAGIAASSPITLGAGTIADMMPVEKRGKAMASWIMGPLIGPTVGPLIGGYLSQAKGWRWIFWLISILAGVVFVATLLFMHESYAYVILQRKTDRLRKETGNQHLRSILDTGKEPKELLQFSIVRPLKLLFLSPIVFMMSLYMATIYGYLYLIVGLAYLGVGIGSFLGLALCGAVSDRLVVALTKRNGGTVIPEYRLPTMFLGVLLVPIVQWIMPIIGSGFVGAGMFAVFMPTQTYLVDAFTVYAASVTAASTVFRSLLGALLPLAGNSMYDALGLGWGTSVLAFIAVAFIPMPLILWKYGQQIRESKFFEVTF
ncbi:fluconazole resistance protein [Usnea florida]